jgi:uncharacterized protein (DUF302 family)
MLAWVRVSPRRQFQVIRAEEVGQCRSMTLVRVASEDSVAETMDRLAGAVDRRGIQVFARIDHAGGARAAGLELADEEVLIFGDPRVGTLLMQSDPEVGYDLPLRVLVRDAAGETAIEYRPVAEAAKSYDLGDQDAVIERIDGLLAQLAAEAAHRA